MTPHDIQRDRFNYLLRYGISADELAQFFREKRLLLLQAGEKVQNPPADGVSARRVILNFGEKAHTIFGAWVTQHVQVLSAYEGEELVGRIRAVESAELELPADERDELMRAGLKALYVENPEDVWIEFLRTPIRPHSAPDEEAEANEWVALARWWLGKGPVPIDPNSPTAAAAALRDAIDHQDPTRIDGSLRLNDASAEIRALIHQGPMSRGPGRRGVVAAGPEERVFDLAFDYTSLVAIATSRSVRTHEPFFATVEAFVDDISGEVFSLSSQDLRRAIPTEGKIVLFADRGFTSQPTPGEAFAYRVERYPTDKPFKVKALNRSDDVLYLVVNLPVSSRDAHKIRDAMVDFARSPTAREAVFVTQDNVCLRPRADNIRQILQPDFSWQLDRWDSLPAVELSNNAYIAAPLPVATSGVDCAPLAVAARRLIKVLANRKAVGITRSQREALQLALEDDALDFSQSTRERLRANIATIDTSVEEFDAFIAELMQSPTIRETVESRVAAELERSTAEREKERQIIEGLQKQRANLEKKIEQLKRESEKRSVAIRAAVLKAFEKAAKQGEELLGQVALFQALLGRSSDKPGADELMEARDSTSIVWREPLPSSGEALADVFRDYGIKKDAARRLAAAVSLGIRLGLPIAVSGIGASLIARRLAQAVCKAPCASADVPVGLLGEADFETPVDWSGGGGGLLLRNANHSDMSLYAGQLLSRLTDRAIAQDLGSTTPVVLSVGNGPAGLPFPPEIASMAIIVDCESVESVLVSDELPRSDEQRSPIWRKISARVEKLATEDSEIEQAFSDLVRLAGAAILRN